MPSRSLDDLDSRFRHVAEELIEEVEAAGVPVTVICTLRSHDEQARAVNAGTSWTLNSKHLPQQPEYKSLAIDLCPTALLTEKGWAPANPAWWIIASIGVSLGLRSGMDWNEAGLPPIGQVRLSWDPGHLEYRLPS